jgi:hypothetical protein
MDSHYYNLDRKKKIGNWVMVQGIGSTDYDLGLYYVSDTVRVLLETSYYAVRNLSRQIPSEEFEIKKENLEVIFINRVLKTYLDVNLAKLVDNRKDVWSFPQLLKAIKTFGWPDVNEIEQEIKAFAIDIRHITKARHERHAHTSRENKPNVIHAPMKLDKYINVIKKAVDLTDRFVDGTIPYILYLDEHEEYDLREMISPQ